MNRKEPAVNRQNLEEIGGLLFELLTADMSEVQRQTGWIIFERKLRQYYSDRRNNRFAIEEKTPPHYSCQFMKQRIE